MITEHVSTQTRLYNQQTHYSIHRQLIVHTLRPRFFHTALATPRMACLVSSPSLLSCTMTGTPLSPPELMTGTTGISPSTSSERSSATDLNASGDPNS
jgi:hypothetical protein